MRYYIASIENVSRDKHTLLTLAETCINRGFTNKEFDLIPDLKIGYPILICDLKIERIS